MNKFIKLFCISLLVAVSASRAMNEEEHKQLGLELIAAAMDGDQERVAELLKRGANVNQADTNGYTALMRAIFYHNVSVAQLLLERGADVNQTDNNGATPLIWATYSGDVRGAQLLLEHGANVNQTDKRGWTPLIEAACNGLMPIAQRLLKHDANVNQANKNGDTPLIIAARNDNEWMVQLLLDHVADVNQANKDGDTPLISAARNEYVPICKRLVKRMLTHWLLSNSQKQRFRTLLCCAQRYGFGLGVSAPLKPYLLELATQENEENKEQPEKSFACEEIQKITDQRIKQHLLKHFSMQPQLSCDIQ